MKKKVCNRILVCMLSLCLAASIGIAVGVSTTANAVTPAATALWRTTDAASTVANNVSTPSYAENGAGVEVVSRSAGSEVEFINPIDVSGKTEIIRLMATPSYRGALDFANLTVWLTDADDDSLSTLGGRGARTPTLRRTRRRNSVTVGAVKRTRSSFRRTGSKARLFRSTALRAARTGRRTRTSRSRFGTTATR